MRYISIFSGIEAATMAARPLGWEPVAFSEIDPFPCALLAHHFPGVPNLGDITKIDWRPYYGEIDLVVGGSPCQSFSVAGNREGLRGESRLMYEYCRAVREIRPEYFLWENVPGALSADGGDAFRQLLDEMGDCGYSIAWRVLDAQFFGVPQRRRRVFVIGRLGDEPPAEILFEPDGVRGDYSPSRAKREELTSASKRSLNRAISIKNDPTIKISENDGPAFTLRASSTRSSDIVCIADDNANAAIDEELCGTLKRGGGAPYDIGPEGSLTPWDHQSTRIFSQNGISCALQSEGDRGADLMPAVLAFDTTQITSKQNSSNPQYGDACHTLNANAHVPAVAINGGYIVRRLTPVECERLQGFPDNYTRIPYKGKPAEECPDTPRYKALGNSFCVPVVRWIFERIDAAERGTLWKDGRRHAGE